MQYTRGSAVAPELLMSARSGQENLQSWQESGRLGLAGLRQGRYFLLMLISPFLALFPGIIGHEIKLIMQLSRVTITTDIVPRQMAPPYMFCRTHEAALHI